MGFPVLYQLPAEAACAAPGGALSTGGKGRKPTGLRPGPGAQAAVRVNFPAKLVNRYVALALFPYPTALGRAHARNAPGKAGQQLHRERCIMPPDGARHNKMMQA